MLGLLERYSQAKSLTQPGIPPLRHYLRTRSQIWFSPESRSHVSLSRPVRRYPQLVYHGQKRRERVVDDRFERLDQLAGRYVPVRVVDDIHPEAFGRAVIMPVMVETFGLFALIATIIILMVVIEL